MWLQLFQSQLGASTSFLDQIREQLVKDFESKTGLTLDVAHTFLHPSEFDKGFQLQLSNGINWVEAELVCHGLGDWCRVAWYSKSNPGEILPSEAPPEDLRVWWDQLQIDSIKEACDAWTKQPASPFPPDRFPFPVEWEVKAGLHWTIKIHAASGILGKVQECLVEGQAEWNDPKYDKDRPGLIHNVKGVIEIKPGHYLVGVDVGSAGVAGLEYLINKIEPISPVRMTIST